MKKTLTFSFYLILILIFSSTTFGDIRTFEEFKESQILFKKQTEKNPGSYIIKPYMGIDFTQNEAKEIEITGVAKGSPADEAGIKAGDIIKKVDGRLINNRYQVFKIFDTKLPGEYIEGEIKRDGKLLKKRVLLLTSYVAYINYVILELICKEIPIRLAILPGESSITHPKYQKDAEQLKDVLLSSIVDRLESSAIIAFRKQNNFSIIDRKYTESVLNELKFQSSGLVSSETRKKIGEMLGASHFMVVNYKMISDESVSGYIYTTVKLVEIESGKILATMTGDFAIETKDKLTTVRQDLIDYYNNDLTNLFTLEKEAIQAYSSITGANFKNDQLSYESLVNIIIPKYEMFVKQLINISPKTTEVKNLHKIYVEGANYQLESFMAFKTAIDKQDRLLMRQANETLAKGKERVEEWQMRIKELSKKENLEIKK